MEEEIGRVSDFFAKPVVAGIDMTGTVKVGDTIHILGHTTDMEITIESMQIDNANVDEAKTTSAVFSVVINSLAIMTRPFLLAIALSMGRITWGGKFMNVRPIMQ